jgi:hypothetical protein
MDHIILIILFTPLAGMFVRCCSHPSTLALSACALVFCFDPSKDYQFVERAPWIPTLGAAYHIGIDGLGLLLVMLTTLLGWISILSSWNAIGERLKEYYALFLLLQTALLGDFMSLYFLLFFIFWETVLVPMYFIIAIWGAPRRVYATIKFVIYTLIGSILMLLGILTLYYRHSLQFGSPSFDFADLLQTRGPLACSGGSSGPSCRTSPSKCPCGRSTPGCPTPTSKRPSPDRHPGQRPPQDRYLWLSEFFLPLLPDSAKGKIEKLVLLLRSIESGHADVQEKIPTEADYSERNSERMRYPKFRRQHLFVGSGVIEAGCKTVIGSRLKQSGMFWTARGANTILALRCCQLNGRFEDYWENRRVA